MQTVRKNKAVLWGVQRGWWNCEPSCSVHCQSAFCHSVDSLITSVRKHHPCWPPSK